LQASGHILTRITTSGPNWFGGSPQHFVVGAVLALAVYCLASWRLRLRPLAAFVLAIGVVSTAEIVWELVEYRVRYADQFHYSAYYDTLGDMANSLVGGVVGALVAVPLARLLARAR
jgi:hypothetical protein